MSAVTLPATRTVSRPAVCLLVGPASIAVGALALIELSEVHPINVLELALVVVWAVSAVVVGVRQRSERLGPIMLAAAGLGSVTMYADASGWRLAASVCLGLLPIVAFQLVASLPSGQLKSRHLRSAVIAMYGVGAVVGLVAPYDASGPDPWPFVVLWIVAVVAGLRVAHGTYLKASIGDRRRMQWVGCSLAMIAEVVLVIVALRLIADWPPQPVVVALGSTALFPLALVAGTHDRMAARIDRLLMLTVTAAGLTATIIVAYVVVVVSLGRDLRDGERSLLLFSMAASVVAAIVYLPVRARLADVANQVVYGERVAPDEALRTWGSRLTRAIPLDELLLQLVESLRKSMSLKSAEILSGGNGIYELAAGVPHRLVAPLRIAEKERAVVARAGVSGGTWLDVWLPGVAPTDGSVVRVAPIAHGGELLGLIMVSREAGAHSFSEEDDRVLTELARQVGLALHNVQLDSALQASLEDLQQANVDLQESRRRIVTAGDTERRKLERNLHDGAQQHLVAMAVKLRIAEDLIEDDPVEAGQVITELRENLRDAIAELRALAHGIYPPLLASGGLPEALPAAATRAALSTTVDTDGVGRHSAEIESTVYFCCLEAMQNAGKYAGEDAEVAVRVSQDGGILVFEISDDGAGFDIGPGGASGHGFINMADRLGTVGGTFAVSSSPGSGTTVRGEIPVS